jgi:hypothetical protein
MCSCFVACVCKAAQSVCGSECVYRGTLVGVSLHVEVTYCNVRCCAGVLRLQTQRLTRSHAAADLLSSAYMLTDTGERTWIGAQQSVTNDVWSWRWVDGTPSTNLNCGSRYAVRPVPALIVPGAICEQLPRPHIVFYRTTFATVCPRHVRAPSLHDIARRKRQGVARVGCEGDAQL